MGKAVAQGTPNPKATMITPSLLYGSKFIKYKQTQEKKRTCIRLCVTFISVTQCDQSFHFSCPAFYFILFFHATLPHLLIKTRIRHLWLRCYLFPSLEVSFGFLPGPEEIAWQRATDITPVHAKCTEIYNIYTVKFIFTYLVLIESIPFALPFNKIHLLAVKRRRLSSL